MKKLINYIKQHVSTTRQDHLLLVTTIYGKSARSLWNTLGYDSVYQFDLAICEAKMKELLSAMVRPSKAEEGILR